MRAYDGPKTFFFLSPPYVGTHNYLVPFTATDAERLRRALKSTRGRWLLLCDDRLSARNDYAGFNQYEVKTYYTLRRGKPEERTQLLVMNYKPTKYQLCASPKQLRPLPTWRAKKG
jgi:DNA adenine methylase